jgi:large subunit ribosomal protein L35
MPKVKTHSGAKKRFKITGTGKIVRRRAMKGHLMQGKSKKVKRDFDKDIAVAPAHVPRVKKLLGRG